MKYTYTNCRDQVYYVRRVTGKRGDRFVCSQKESADNLETLPEGFEIAESPNGQVSCRKALVSLILPEEMELAQTLTAKLASQTLIKCEQKEDAIIIYSAQSPNLADLGFPGIKPDVNVRDIWAKILQFQAALKFELSDRINRKFAVFRMTWRGDCDWMFLSEGTLESLLKKYAPHIEEDSFYELF